MFDYISLRIDSEPCDETINDLLAAFLADLDFESFLPDDKGVTAFVRKDLFDVSAVDEMLSGFPIPATFKTQIAVIEGEDWNKEWEQNYYEPIVIDNKCVIRASFHKDTPKGDIEIIIDPKMAFGTGHHFTTATMVRLILSQDLKGKDVIDMGSGTGILAILCKKLGADSVTAIEIDPYALENAEENGELNCVDIKWVCGDASALDGLKPADLFLANINRNVILSDLSKYATHLKEDGNLFLSGFYIHDLPVIEKAAALYGLSLKDKMVDNEWVGAVFMKK